MEVLLGAPLTIRYKLRFPRGPKISSAGELGDQEKNALSHPSFNTLLYKKRKRND